MSEGFNLSDLMVPEGLDFRPTMTTCTIEGILEEEDLRQLLLSPADVKPEEDNPADLKKIREKHHHVARLIADGLQQRLVANITGYTEGYISILLNNPAMVELVELYRIKGGAAAAITTENLKTMGLKAVEKLNVKIDNDDLNNTELLAAAKLGLDRGGHGPQSKTVAAHEHHLIDHARLTELNLEARRRNADFIVSQDDIREAIDDVAKMLPPPRDDGE